MRYWPLSDIAKSPLLHHSQTWELMRVEYIWPLSGGTMHACSHIAAQTPPAGGAPMVLVHTEGAISRCAYLQPPTYEDWLKFERAGFVDTGGAFGIVIDVLH